MKSWHHLPDLYFLHIPKTAGTSIRTWLIDLFPEGARVPAHHLREMEALPASAIRSARLASGHFGWRLVERAEQIGKHFEVITFLRDVVSLRMSTLSYVTNLTEAEVAALGSDVAEETRRSQELASSFDLAQYVKTATFDTLPTTLGEEHKNSQNVYVHYLGGSGTEAEPLLTINEASYAVAAKRLRDIVFAGVVEEMDWSMALLCDRLGLPLQRLGAKQNVSANHLVPSADYAAACRNWDSLGLRLYEDAVKRLEEQKRALCARFELPAEAPVDALGDGMRDAFLKTDRDVERVRNAHITMADGSVADGLARRLHFEPYDRWIRWAKKESTVYLPLDPGDDRTIRFEVASVMSNNIRDGLTLSVNGYEIPLKRSYKVWRDGEYHMICDCVIPSGAMNGSAQYTALDFSAPDDEPTEDPESMGERASFALADIYIT